MKNRLVQVSADGNAFTPLQPLRNERSFKGGKTLAEYECVLPPGNRFFRLLWNGPAELDRAEIYHSGTK